MARIPLRLIAEATGVSRMTVSLALRGHASIPAATRTRIVKAARRLGYRPDAELATVMARLRRGPESGRTANLAVLDFCSGPQGLLGARTHRRFFAGIRRRCEALGFAVEIHRALDPACPPTRLRRILDARGVQGVFAVRGQQTGTPRVREIFSGPVVQLGQRGDGEDLDFATNDQFATAQLAVRELAARGARRLALAIGSGDRDVEHRYSGGFLSMRAARPDLTFLPVLDSDELPSAEIRVLLRRERADAVLLHAAWLGAALTTRSRVRIAQLDWSDEFPFAGTDQQSELVGEMAAEQLIARIRLPAEGPRRAPRGIFLQSVWREPRA